MKTLQVVLEPGKDGFGVMFRTKGLENITSFGITLDEAKKNAKEALIELVDFYNETGRELPPAIAEINPDKIRLRFSFMLNHYLKEFPYLNISKLAERININPSLLRQYDRGLIYASENKYLELKKGLNVIGRELQSQS